MMSRLAAELRIVFGCFLLAANVASAQTSSSGITIVSPASGTTVSPGTSVHVIVQVDPSVNPNTVLVATGGLAAAYLSLSTAPYEGDLMVPSTFTGPLTVMALVRTTSSAIVQGPSITVNVAPADSPKSIELPGVVHLHVPGPDPDGARALTVMGDYADGSRRKISAGALGTTYSTSNPTVVTVDVDGVLTATGSGIAYVTVQNGAARAETEVIVGNGSSNSVPVSEVTNQVHISASGFRRDPDTGLYVQEVTIRNISALPIPKTLSLVIGGLPSGVVVANTRGKTKNVTPVGSYIVTVKSAEMSFLSPGSTGTALIEFRNPTGGPITYTSRPLEGTAPAGYFRSIQQRGRVAGRLSGRHNQAISYRMKSSRRLCCAILLAPWLTACGAPMCYTAAPIDARVVDEDTKQPIEGAVVIAQWKLFRPNLEGYTYKGSLEIKETTTDKDGRFHFDGFTKLNPWLYELHGDDPLVIVFKSGYEYKRLNDGYLGNGYSDYPGRFRNPQWNGQTATMEKLQGIEYAEPRRFKWFYGSLNIDLEDLTSGTKGCEWKKAPKLILAMDAEKRRLKSLFPDAVVSAVGIDDVPRLSACGDPRTFFENYAK